MEEMIQSKLAVNQAEKKVLKKQFSVHKDRAVIEVMVTCLT